MASPFTDTTLFAGADVVGAMTPLTPVQQESFASSGHTAAPRDDTSGRAAMGILGLMVLAGFGFYIWTRPFQR